MEPIINISAERPGNAKGDHKKNVSNRNVVFSSLE
jgi:hypothetical protein